MRAAQPVLAGHLIRSLKRRKMMLRNILVALLIISGFVNAAIAGNEVTLERGLLDAMRLKPDVSERSTKSGPMIMAYVKDGYLDLKPIQRADYTDYRLFKKPAQLMGHRLMLVEEEYMAKHIGCCVSEGLGVTVKVVGSTDCQSSALWRHLFSA